MKYAFVNRSCYRDTPFSLHSEGCRDISKDIRVNDGHLTIIEAETIDAALDIIIDPELVEMGYDHGHVRVYPCCKDGK